MSIIYLYIKQHQNTKLLYFGKTIKKYNENYKGSGIYWVKHIKKHGNFIDTLCIWEFENQEECTNFALKFSKENNIVDSDKWANLIDENGAHGGVFGHKAYNKGKKQSKELIEKRKKLMIGKNKGKITSEITKNKQKIAKLGKKREPFTRNHKEKISIGNRGKIISDKTKEKMSFSQKNIIWITNEIISKRINKNNLIPEGWRRGRIDNGKNKGLNI